MTIPETGQACYTEPVILAELLPSFLARGASCVLLMSCIGTAGHIDHGKSTLVEALTGIDPDRLAEEKARAMTIDLGFPWLTLPTAPEATLAHVPAHTPLIKHIP